MSNTTLPTAAFESLKQLSLAIDKTDCRTYATVIGIRNGHACVTNGFFLVQWSCSLLNGIDSAFKPTFAESVIKFPQWQECISLAPEPLEVWHDALLGLMQHYKPVRAELKARIMFAANDDGSLQVPSLQYAPQHGYSYNPALIFQAMKALPKKARMFSAQIHGEQLQLRFGANGEWLIIILSTRNA